MTRWLEIHAGGLAFGSRAVLCDINVHVGSGVTILLGRNGAGKTTLCRVCAGDVAWIMGRSNSSSPPRLGGRADPVILPGWDGSRSRCDFLVPCG